MTSDPRVHAGGGARGQNLVHLQKLGYLCLSFLDVYILAITSPTHSTVVYNLHVHVHADIPNVDTEWSEDLQLGNHL